MYITYKIDNRVNTLRVSLANAFNAIAKLLQYNIEITKVQSYD